MRWISYTFVTWPGMHLRISLIRFYVARARHAQHLRIVYTRNHMHTHTARRYGRSLACWLEPGKLITSHPAEREQSWLTVYMIIQICAHVLSIVVVVVV